MFEYIPTSDVIKEHKRGYEKAYTNSSQDDELDLGYFIQYILETVLLSIERFQIYLRKKMEREEFFREYLNTIGHFNNRQVSIINTLSKHNNPLDIATHKIKFGLSYEVARRDFLRLEKSGLLKKSKRGKKFVYTLANPLNIKTFKGGA